MTLGAFALAPAAADAASRVSGDFNGDGRDDLAIGVPQEDDGQLTNAGAVNVIYGEQTGLTPDDDDVWSQGSPGIKGRPEAGDRFGSSLAAGDFNGDGRDDLAIGAPLEDDGPVGNTGVVNVIYGGMNGLTPADDDVWSQEPPGIHGRPELGDRFGSSLSAGDFSGDGRDDLAIGVVLEDEGSIEDAGAVNVIDGAESGLTEIGDQLWSQASTGIKGAPESDDLFGGALAAGDFGHERRVDLAIGVSGENNGPITDAGAVNVIYSGENGLTPADDQVWSQDSPGIKNAPGLSDHFGSSLAAGNFTGLSRDALAIGVPDENEQATETGAVNVIYAGDSGLSDVGNQYWSQGTAGIKGGLEEDDRFGVSLTAGDFNGDLAVDLAVGVPDESGNAINLSGAVNVIYGGANALTPAGDQFWKQATPGIKGEPEQGDRFGSPLSAGDFNGGGGDDLAIGVPLENNTKGAVNVIYGGGASGLTPAGDEIWSQGTSGIQGTPETEDYFGASLPT